MAGDYPSVDFEISEEGDVRRVVHLQTGIVIETTRVPGDPVAVSRVFRIEAVDHGADPQFHPQEVAQAALRHLRVWLMRRYAKGRRGAW